MKKKYNEGYEGVASKIFWPWHNETGDWNIVMDVPANQQQGACFVIRYSTFCKFSNILLNKK